MNNLFYYIICMVMGSDTCKSLSSTTDGVLYVTDKSLNHVIELHHDDCDNLYRFIHKKYGIDTVRIVTSSHEKGWPYTWDDKHNCFYTSYDDE